MARRQTVEQGRIVEAAAALLAAGPAEGVTIAAVARSAGVSTGTVYNYFRNKDHLIAAASGTPGALSGWVEPVPGRPEEAQLRELAVTALERFRLLGAGEESGRGAIGAEVEGLAERLAGYLEARGAARTHGIARVFYGALAAAVLLGWNREEDPALGTLLAEITARSAGD